MSAPVPAGGGADTLGTLQMLNASLSTPARRSGMHTALNTSERLLLQRRAALLQQLMAEQPEQVRAATLPPEVLTALAAADPPSAALLEREISLTGELTRQVADDFDHGTHQELLQLHAVEQTGADLRVFTSNAVTTNHAGAGFHLLHRHVTITGIALGDSIAADVIAPAVPVANAATARRDTRPHAEIAGATADPLNCATTGQQKTAVLLLRFPGNTPAFPGNYAEESYWQAAMTGPHLSVNDFWTTLSGGRTTATADVYNNIQLPQNYSCQDYLSLRTAALEAAQASVDFSRYTRIVLAFPTGNCSYGGLADVGCNAADTLVHHPYSVVWLPVLTRYGPNVAIWGGLAHELGHNLGLNHANSLDFGPLALGPLDFQATNPGTVIGSGAVSATGGITAVDTEYGDPFSAMGVPWTGGPYSADHRAHLLGWIPSSGAHPDAVTSVTPGRYTLLPAESGSGLRALRVLRDAVSSSWLWLEYHVPDSGYTSGNLLLISGENETAGATIHYENGYGDPDKTWQLNMARSPASPGNSFAGAALLPGQSWSDPYSALTLSVESASPAGQSTSAGQPSPAELVVNVAHDPTCATFALPADPIPAMGGSGTVAVQAPAGCAWAAFTNSTWLSLTGGTSGTGNGSFGFTAAANTGSAQRVTYLTVDRQSSRLLQTGTGASIISLSPQNGSAPAGTSTVFTLTVSSSPSQAGIGEIELDITGTGTDPCTVLLTSAGTGAPLLYLYNRTNDAYSTGLTAGSNQSLSIPGCTLSGARSGITSSVGNGGTAMIHYALDLAFPADQPGVRSFFATVGPADTLPVGLFDAGQTLPLPPVSPPPPPATSTTSTVTLTISSGTALPGSPVSLFAAVTGSGSTVAPTGTVRFLEGSNVLGTAALDGNAHCTLTVGSLGIGTHGITAAYAGDAVFPASISNAQAVVIGKRTPALTLQAAANRVFANMPVALSISASSAAPGTAPTGNVLLQDGSALLATLPLSLSGTAAYMLPPLPAGTHNLVATYAGDAIHTPAVGSTTVQVLDFALTAPGGPLLLKAGSLSNNSATLLLTPGAGGFPVPVAFTCSGAPPQSTCAVTPALATPGSTILSLTVTLQSTAATALHASSAASPATRLAGNTAESPSAASSESMLTHNTEPDLRHTQGHSSSITLERKRDRPAEETVAQAITAICAFPCLGWLAGLIRHRNLKRKPRRLPDLALTAAPLALCAIATLALTSLCITGCGSGGNLIDAPAPPSSGSTTGTGTLDPSKPGSSPGTPAGSYTLTVTATATNSTSTLSHTALVQVIIR